MENQWRPRNGEEERQATTTTVLEKLVERLENTGNDRSASAMILILSAFLGMDS